MKKIPFLVLFLFANFIGTAQISHKISLLRTLKDNLEPVNCLAYSPNGKILAYGFTSISFFSEPGNYDIIVWNTVTNKIMGQLSGHKMPVTSLVFNKSGNKLVSADEKGEIKIWDVLKFKEIKPINCGSYIGNVCLTPDNRFIIHDFRFKKGIQILDFNTGKLISMLSDSEEPGSMDISSDGNKIYISSEKKIQVWSLISKQLIATVKNHNPTGFALKCSRDGKYLAVGLYNGDIIIYDAETLISKFTLKGHFKPVICLSFNNNGRYLISGSHDQMVNLWMITSRTEIKSLINIHKGKITSVVFNPISNSFATTGEDYTIKFWNIN